MDPSSRGNPFSKRALFAALNYKPHKGQIQIHAALERGKVVSASCGARFGKTMAASFEMAFEALLPREVTASNRTGEFVGWCVGPDHDKANLVFQATYDHLKRILKGNVQINNTDGVITITNMGGTTSRIYRKSADNAGGKGKLTGYAVDFMVVDEAAKILDDRVWENQLRTRLIDREGKCLMISTPMGTGGFFAATYRRSRDDENIIGIRLPTYLNPHVKDSVIDAERASMPERDFRQEYLAEFIPGEGKVFEPKFLDPISIGDFEEPREGAHYFAGLDLAIKRDYTVLTIFRAPDASEEDQRPRVVHVDRFHKLPVDVQVQRVKATTDAYGGCGVMVDESGLGGPIVQLLRNAEIYVRGIIFTHRSKSAMVKNACAIVERGAIVLPRRELMPIMHDEIAAYAWKSTPGGDLTANAPDGMHDDCVASFLLACHWIRAGGTEGKGRSLTGAGETGQVELAQRNPGYSDKSGDSPYVRGAAVPKEDGGRAFTQRGGKGLWSHSLGRGGMIH